MSRAPKGITGQILTICIIQAQAEEAQATDLSSSEPLNQEKGFFAFAKRLLILNSSKLVALCIFATVTQHPSAVSLVLLGEPHSCKTSPKAVGSRILDQRFRGIAQDVDVDTAA